jgi:hypothetical protein
MKRPSPQQFNITITFCEDEEENKAAYKKALKIILSRAEKGDHLNK